MLLTSMYQPPFNQYAPTGEPLFDQEEAQKHFEEFYEDVFTELSQFGEVEELNVCANLGDHLMGNVYVKFREEDSARKALETCKGRYYGGRPLICELSPVTDFREARCRQYDMGECARGGFCNFMHLRVVPRDLNRKLTDWQRKVHRRGHRSRSKSRSRSRSRDRRRSSRRSRSRSRDRRRERRERSRSRSRERGAENKERGTESKERGTESKERGTESKERGTENRERSSRKRERSRSRERDAPEAKRHESEQRYAEQQNAGTAPPTEPQAPDAVHNN
jgi:splicing factor U2AF subunit